MATIEIPKVRKESTVIMYVSLTDNGVTVDWTSLSEIKPFMYSDEQHCIAGKCTAEIATGAPETLIVRYPTTAPQFLGQNSLLIRCTYDGNEKSFDVPVLEFVDRSSEATGVTVIEDPELPVAIEVQDVDTSVLDDAIAAALDAAAKATAAAELVPLDILAQCQAAAEAAEAAAENCAPVIGDNGNWWIYDYDAGEYVDSGKPSRGIQGEQGIQGIQGIQGNTGSSVDYPYELVNNLTTDDATKGLSAAQGVALKAEVSQLDQEVNGGEVWEEVPVSLTDSYYITGANNANLGKAVYGTAYKCTGFIALGGAEKVRITCAGKSDSTIVGLAFYDEDNVVISNSGHTYGGETSDNNSLRELNVPSGAVYIRSTYIKAVGGDFKCYLPTVGPSLSQRISDNAKDIADLELAVDLRQESSEDIIPVSMYKENYYIGNGDGNVAGADISYNGRAIATSLKWRKGDTIRLSYLKSGGTSSSAIALYKEGVFVKSLLSGNSGVVINSQTDYTPEEDFDEVRFTLNSLDLLNNISDVIRLRSGAVSGLDDAISELHPKVNILCFGNSFTQDAVNYSPWIIKGLAPGLKLNITMAYINGCTMAQHCANITGIAQTVGGITYNPGVDYSCYHYTDNEKKWSSAETLSAADALASKKWDIITFQMNGASNFGDYDTYYAPFLGPTFKALAEQLAYAFKLGWLLTHGSYSGDVAELLTRWEGSAENSEKVLERTPVDFLIPYGTAIQNLRTTSIAVGNVGAGSLLADNIHLQEGIATLCASYSVALAILSVLGIPTKLVGENTRPTSAWISGHNCPGGNYAVSGVVEGVTDENCYLAQFAAIAAQSRPYEVTTIN